MARVHRVSGLALPRRFSQRDSPATSISCLTYLHLSGILMCMSHMALSLCFRSPLCASSEAKVHGRFAEVAQFTCVRYMLSVFVHLFLLFDVKILRRLDGRGSEVGKCCGVGGAVSSSPCTPSRSTYPPPLLLHTYHPAAPHACAHAHRQGTHSAAHTVAPPPHFKVPRPMRESLPRLSGFHAGNTQE